MRNVILIILSWVLILFAQWSHEPVAVLTGAGVYNPHYTNGGRNIVRIGNTVVVIAKSGAGEYLYQSTDNGENWSQIDSNGLVRGCLLSGADSTFYYFFLDINNDRIRMVKWVKGDSPPAPVTIYSNSSVGDAVSGTYRFTSASIDSTGKIYVCSSWGSTEEIYILSSDDAGSTWSGPYQASAAGTSDYYGVVNVSPENLLVVSYTPYASPNTPIIARSSNGGQTWTRTQVTSVNYPNPNTLFVGDRLFLFTQCDGASPYGVKSNYSTDNGANWGSWVLVNTTCAYGDPSSALGSDSTIYVGFRSSDGTGLTIGSCGDQSQYRMAQSTNFGTTWTYPDDFGYGFVDRAVEHCHLRYQTWFNYGGPLEWVFYQEEDSRTNYNTYYDINTDVTILSYQATGGTPAAKSTKSLYIIRGED